MRVEFLNELQESGWIHRPLFIKKEYSMEQVRKNRKVTKKKKIKIEKSKLLVQHGKCKKYNFGDDEILWIKGGWQKSIWPEEMPQDGDCAYYGNLSVKLKLNHEDWRDYNRISFQIHPVCPGLHTISFAVWIKNEGLEKVPDVYNRTGQYMFNLENRQWQTAIWEFPEIARDNITELEFRYRLSGSDTGVGEKVMFAVKNIFLEKTKEEKYQGWDLEEGVISYDFCGYLPNEKKIALTDLTIGKFRVLREETGDVILRKAIEKIEWKNQKFGYLDFSEIKEPGKYKLLAEGRETGIFQVGTDWIEEMIWKGLNFLFCQRCGYPVPGKHQKCHDDCYGTHNGEKISYCGGWHDAGDMSQQTVQTGEITEELFVLAEENKKNRLLYHRLLEEACWGLSFLLQGRYGDGYRNSSLGLIRWTDNKWGNLDDGNTVRVYNHALDNFLCACAEAVAARVLEKYDYENSFVALKVAEEDYTFAIERWEKYGFETPIMWEHTYGSSQSLCYAVITKCAGLLYERTGKTYYGKQVEIWSEKLLLCQNEAGYFYRDESCSNIVHFNHQAREKYFPESLILACRVLKEGKLYSRIIHALRKYGNYLKELMEYASPYRMIPAGIYEEREANHKEVFQRMHLLSSYQECQSEYLKQVRQGDRIGDGQYVKQFPVWFSFRGNTNVQLSMGQAAIITGEFLGDEELIQIGRDQIHWLNGKNPFRQSLVVGNGKRFDFFYAVFPGVCVGQVPVGIQTKKNEDFPVWNSGNQAVSREVWDSSTIKMMSICGKNVK